MDTCLPILTVTCMATGNFNHFSDLVFVLSEGGGDVYVFALLRELKAIQYSECPAEHSFFFFPFFLFFECHRYLGSQTL